MASRKTQDALAKSTKSNVTEEVKVMTSPAGLTRAGAAEKEVAILRERVAEAPERILPILASIAGRALPALERIAEALEGIEDTLEAKPVYTGSPEHVKALLAEPVKAVASRLFRPRSSRPSFRRSRGSRWLAVHTRGSCPQLRIGG